MNGAQGTVCLQSETINSINHDFKSSVNKLHFFSLLSKPKHDWHRNFETFSLFSTVKLDGKYIRWGWDWKQRVLQSTTNALDFNVLHCYVLDCYVIDYVL